MKKIFLLLPVFIAASFVSTFAAPTSDDTEKRAEQNFKSQFVGADNVQWSKADNDYSRVAFTWAGHRTEAYFNERGEFAGAIRGLFYAQLPMAIIRSVDAKFNDRVILEVREVTNPEGSTYSILLESKGKRLRVRVSANGYVEEVKKVK